MVLDPTWIAAGSQVLGEALKTSASSESDSGGVFGFGANTLSSPFVVTTGSGAASLASGPSLLALALVAAGAFVLWKLAKKF